MLNEAASLYPSLFLHTWGYQLVPSLHSNCRGQYTCLHFYGLYTSEISFPHFFSLYNRSQNKEAKPLLRKLGSNGLKGSCSTFFYRYIQHHAELWKEDIEQLFIHYHISSSRSLSHSHLHKYRSSCADIKTKIKNTQVNLKCL